MLEMTYFCNNILAIIFILFLLIRNYVSIEKQLFLIYISSCNRFYYFNITINTILIHMKEFETINFHIILFDQGTIELHNNSYIKSRMIYNIFYMNPSGYIFSYNVIFSFLYSKYALLIDDDRPVRKNIEKYLTYTNFITTSINIMDKYKEIYGIILKWSGDGKANCLNEIIHNRNIGFCIIKEAHIGYYYTNGASVYRTNELKKVEIYSGEYEVAKFFSLTKYRMAYILINDICNTTSNKCNYVIEHIGKNSSLKNRNICSISLY